MERRLRFDQLLSQTTGLSLQCLGPAEAGGKGPAELHPGLSPQKPAVPETWGPLGKERGAGCLVRRS